MDQPRNTIFRVGTWLIDPASGQISRDDEVVRLDTRAMRLLQCLARHAGAVVSIDELLDQVWSGVIVTPDSVYQAVASLRRSLGDDPKQPIYIATVPRLGYRMVAEVVESWPGGGNSPTMSALPLAEMEDRADASTHPVVRRRHRTLLAMGGLATLTLILVLYLVVNPFGASPFAPAAEKCVGVLPFRDMTDAMDEEPFADGMTEQLIDAFSKIPGTHVPSLTSSLYFKGKQTTIAEVSKKLGVAYVLEGSVRKSGNTLRITAQLIRADDGYVVWSNSYDRPTTDLLQVQSDIATKVMHALEASLKHPYSVGDA
ncbi:winged helix-turn-helix domain-containing protein [Rhodanobacter sp. C01]|uniref:winged helix-turn-helix domain-containing protein n=1 Tax=Rhodanobacter sp. C01 TaxID=1945856 RepID=UPI0009876050|nr:winged helix-turn-helix domain-containing protein [Rhodanobacter sp. C01]OOG45894.1 transcriptional regulator [Rhodanobacter sp. C01]